MTVLSSVTLTPSSTVSVGSMTVNGAGSADEVLSDADDATYLTGNVASVPSGAEVTLTDGSFPSGARIVAVRGLLRGRRGTAAPVGKLSLGLLRAGQATGVVQQVSVADTAVADYTTTWLTEDPYNNPWTVESVQSQTVHLATEGSARLVEFALEVEYDERPTVVVDPLGTVTDTSTPTVTWTYDDPEGSSQQAYRVVLKTAGGVLVLDTGWKLSSVREHTLPTLENGTSYTVEVTVRHASGWDWHASEPDAVSFTVDLDTPAPPVVTVVEYPDLGVVTLELEDPTVSPDPAAEWFTVEFRDDPADGWTMVRGASEVLPGSPSVLVADYEAPLGVQRTYRVRGATDASGQTVASDPTVATATLNAVGRWITDPYDPDGLNVKVSTKEHARSWSGREQVHYPAGMAVAVVESEPTVGHQSLSVWTLNPADHELLVAAFRNRTTLLYRDRRTTMYFRWIGDRSSQQLGPDATGVDALSGSMVEVARPS